MSARDTPRVKCSGRLLTVAEAEAALEHAAAFIELARSLDPANYGIAAGERFAKYGPAAGVAGLKGKP